MKNINIEEMVDNTKYDRVAKDLKVRAVETTLYAVNATSETPVINEIIRYTYVDEHTSILEKWKVLDEQSQKKFNAVLLPRKDCCKITVDENENIVIKVGTIVNKSINTNTMFDNFIKFGDFREVTL